MPHARPRIPARLTLLALLALLAAYLLGALLAAPRPPPPAGPSLLDRGAARVFFTTPALTYPDAPARRPPSPLLRAVLADLGAARASIDLAVFDLDLPEIGAALARAHRRGVAVRVVLDSHNLEAPETAAVAGALQRAGVPLRLDRREPFMHDKVIVMDGAVVWAGSWNMTANDTYRNSNNMLRIVSRPLAAAYARDVRAMFGGAFGAGKESAGAPGAAAGGRVAAYFSPEGGAEEAALRVLAGARRSVRFMAFSFTSAPIAEAMVALARRGVEVRGVFERQNAAGTGSVLGALRGGGVEVLEDGACYLLHNKVIVVDERVVITGSYNFTGSAEHSNDENMLVVADPGVARAYLEEFERVYALARSPQRCL